MKKSKILISIVMLLALCLSLCSCGISESKAVGTWAGTYVYSGNQFARAFTLAPDGTYVEVSYKNGSLNRSETGTYEIKGGEVILHENGDMGVATKYTYKGGKLINNGHEFSKSN